REAVPASAWASPRAVPFVEPLEDPREVLLGNAGPQIPHRDLNPGVVCSGRDDNVPRSCELERVVDDILQGLVGLAPVAQRMDAVLNRLSSELESGRCCSLLVAIDDLCDEPADAEGCTLDLDALSIQRRELHKIEKDRLQPLRFLNDAIQEKSGIALGRELVSQRLGRQVEPGEGCAELMRKIGHKLLTHRPEVAAAVQGMH